MLSSKEIEIGRTYQVGLLLPEEVFGLLVPVCVATAPFDAVVVTTLSVAQKSVNHFLTAVKSASVVQLCALQTRVTPVVPPFVKAARRESEQKQLSSTAAMLGGVHLPCTSKRGPHFEAQAGRPDVKGTISPSGEAAAAAALAVAAAVV